MTDYIKRAEALKDFEASNAENPRWTPQRVKTLLMRQPAADVAEVVRCKDCKYFLPPIKSVFTACSYTKGGGMLAPNLNDFCSYGERRNDGKRGDDTGD